MTKQIDQALFTFLGTGSSLGIPVIGCSCPTCQSKDPHNKRRRSGAYVQLKGKTWLIDAGPDLREQALSAHLTHIDGFILTHAHYDHIGGFDDLKVYSALGHQKLPCLMLKDSFLDLKVRYPYLFNSSPFFSYTLLEDRPGQITFTGISLDYLTYRQTGTAVMGIKLGNLAYLSDIKDYEETIFSHLQSIDILILSALRFQPSPAHFSIDEALAFSKKTSAKKVFLTHMAHEIDHSSLQKSLPSSIFLAYDGLQIPFTPYHL